MEPSFVALMCQKAWDRKHQGKCTGKHPIQTHNFQYHARTLYFFRRKVAIHYSMISFVCFPHPLASRSHTVVMEMEIEFFYKNCRKNPKLLIDHIQKMKSGDAPFFPTTLGLVYDKLFGDPLPQPAAPGSGLGRSLDARNAKRAPAVSPSIGSVGKHGSRAVYSAVDEPSGRGVVPLSIILVGAATFFMFLSHMNRS